MSKMSEFKTVGDGIPDVPAVRSCVILMFSEKSQHFRVGPPGGRPLHIGSPLCINEQVVMSTDSVENGEKTVPGVRFQIFR